MILTDEELAVGLAGVFGNNTANSEYPCCVCDRACPVEADYNGSGSGHTILPAKGESLKCQTCESVCHLDCAAESLRVCRDCGACDVCGPDASVDGVWVVRNTAEPIESSPLNSQEFLCPSDLADRKTVI